MDIFGDVLPSIFDDVTWSNEVFTPSLYDSVVRDDGLTGWLTPDTDDVPLVKDGSSDGIVHNPISSRQNKRKRVSSSSSFDESSSEDSYSSSESSCSDSESSESESSDVLSSDIVAPYSVPSKSPRYTLPSLQSCSVPSREPIVMYPHGGRISALRDRDSYSCDECGKSFRYYCKLRMHMFVHTGVSEFVCGICGEMSSSNSTLKVHMNVHLSENTYTCRVCNKSFKHKSSLRNHEATHNKKFKCSECGKKFATKGCLSEHIRSHTGEKPFKCSVCGNGFATKSQLNVHVRTHTRETPCKCSECGRGFTNTANRLRHERNVHGINNNKRRKI